MFLSTWYVSTPNYQITTHTWTQTHKQLSSFSVSYHHAQLQVVIWRYWSGGRRTDWYALNPMNRDTLAVIALSHVHSHIHTPPYQSLSTVQYLPLCWVQGYEVAYTVHQKTGISSILVDSNMYERDMGEAVRPDLCIVDDDCFVALMLGYEIW